MGAILSEEKPGILGIEMLNPQILGFGVRKIRGATYVDDETVVIYRAEATGDCNDVDSLHPKPRMGCLRG